MVLGSRSFSSDITKPQKIGPGALPSVLEGEAFHFALSCPSRRFSQPSTHPHLFQLLRTCAAELHFSREIRVHQRQASMRRRANLL